MSKIRTMKLLGLDRWCRPIYRCIETKELYKDVNLGEGTIALHSCDNAIDGEPSYPINSDLEVVYEKRGEKPWI